MSHSTQCHQFNDSVQADIKPTHSEFEKRTALNQFKRLATTDCLVKIANGLSVGVMVDEFHQLTELANIFVANSPLCDDRISATRFINTIKRRDAEYMAMLANDFHRPGCMTGNPAYELKLLNIARGKTVELSPVN